MIEILEHSVAAEASVESDRGHALWLAVQRRRVPIALMVATVVTMMAYSLFWGPAILHHPDWLERADIWGSFRTGQFVAWGDIGDIYGSGGGLAVPPGISVALAPAAILISHLGLTIGFPVDIAHPTAWLVLGPYVAVLGSIVLIPLDALAEELGLGRGARVASSLSEAAVLWPVLAIWGHPEDSLAMAFAVWGLLAALRGRWRRTGWLWGFALVMQPLVVLMVPIVFAVAPKREWPKMALKSALPTVLLVAIPFVQSWRQTTTALLKQPNYPALNHPTPWLSLAPVLSRAQTVKTAHAQRTTLPDGVTHFGIRVGHVLSAEVVAAGPGRLIAIGLAVLLGVYAYRRRPTHEQIVWLCFVALSLRCVFEAVMDPYYLWPPLAIGFVLVARDRSRFIVAVLSSAVLIWWSYLHLGPWEWWAPIVVLLGMVVAAATPAGPTTGASVALGEHVKRTPSRSAVDALV